MEGGNPVYVLTDVRKAYGRKQVLKGISLAIQSGEVVGLVGPNGAGKTTTMRLMTGLLRPDAGAIVFRQQDIREHPDILRDCVGYVPDDPFLYPQLTGKELLYFVADIRQLPRRTSAERVSELLSQFDLAEVADRFIEEYSMGMKRKIGFCLALLHKPEFLILDEPLNGLDPKAVRVVKDLFHQCRLEGRAVLLSTHLLDVAQQMCDSIVLIHDGEVKETCRTVDLNVTLEERYFQITGTGVQ